MRINVNTGRFQSRGYLFNPKGGLRFHGPKRNPVDDLGEGVYSGLIIVGLEGRDDEKYTLKDVIEIVKEVREEQAGDPGSSFLSQKGLFKDPNTGKVFDENSIRIILLHLTKESKRKFKENILDLAELLRESLNQQTVIVEFQNKGVTERIYAVHAED